MVNFKEGRVWTAQRKKDLIIKTITNLSIFGLKEIFEVLRPDFDNTRAGSLQATYYDILKNEPDAVLSVMKKLDEENTQYTNPYTIGPNMKSRPNIPDVEVKAVVEDIAEVSDIMDEDTVLEGFGNLLENLSKLPGVDIGGLIKGLVALTNMAVNPPDTPEVMKKDSDILKLQEDLNNANLNISELESSISEAHEANRKLIEENSKLREDLESVSFIVDEFFNMNTATKIANLGKISTGLKLTVDKYGNVLRAEKDC